MGQCAEGLSPEIYVHYRMMQPPEDAAGDLQFASAPYFIDYRCIPLFPDAIMETVQAIRIDDPPHRFSKAAASAETVRAEPSHDATLPEPLWKKYWWVLLAGAILVVRSVVEQPSPLAPKEKKED